MKVVRSGWEPFEVTMLGGLAVTGFGGLLLFDRLEGSTVAKFPAPWGHMLLLLICVTSVVTLIGAARQDLLGVKIERAGLLGVTGLGLSYSVWAFGVNGLAAYAFGVILLCVVVGALWRLARIRHDLRTDVS